MKEIKLTKGLVALVDDEMYDYLNQWEWRAVKMRGKYYAYPSDKNGNSMHRIIANTPEGMECDHRDGNTLNNQNYNLRNVTVSQNQMNRGAQVNNSLGEKGISPHNRGYRVQVRRNKQTVFDRTFKTLEEAIVRRNEAYKEHHGEFGKY